MEAIMALQNIRRKSAVVAAVVGLGALVVAGCSREAMPNAAHVMGTSAGAPLSVACEPNQRAVVRQMAVNGVAQSQVQCETVGAPAFAGGGTAVGYGATPVAYQPGFQPVSYAPLENTRLAPAPSPQEVVTREAAPRRAVNYQRAPERVAVRQPKRSVQKSAIIIGSSAGVGAGIGAAVGGKKGAGIGALLGGGGAALWDQMTRRK
jgi:hypothetical protein